jgi:hypothetical protein
MKKLQAALIIAGAMLFANGAWAEAPKLDSFHPMTLAEAKANFLVEACKPVPGTGGKLLTSYFDHGGQGWRARASYTGRSRDLEAEELAFIRLWLRSIRREDAVGIFTTSHLFTVDGADYWLPVETPVAEFFPKELKPGDRIDLYVAEIGGTRRGDEWLWLPLVEEFEKVKKADKMQKGG